MQGILQSLESSPCKFLEGLNNKLAKDLETFQLQEEVFWQQSSCDWWFVLGDRFTFQFHARVTVNSGRSCIPSLKIMIMFFYDSKVLKDMARDFFFDLYFDDMPNVLYVLTSLFSSLPQERVNSLCVIPKENDVKQALRAMDPNKVLGPNGFSASFYQNYWINVKDSLLNQVISVFRGSSSIGSVNLTLSSLILKISSMSIFLYFILLDFVMLITKF